MLSLKTAKERWDPRWSCLLVVDVQNDFCSPKGSCAERGEDIEAAQEIIPRVVRFIEEARRVALPIIYVQTTHSEWTDSPSQVFRKLQPKSMTTCREGTWGAEFCEAIAPLPEERIVIKHRYSAFINTDLNTVLRARAVESVIVTGVATNVCVETTARDAYMFDYYVTVVEDCSAAYTQRAHEGAIENIRNHFGLVAPSEEIVKTWRDWS